MTPNVQAIENISSGILVGAQKGLFRYEKGILVEYPGQYVGYIRTSKQTKLGVLIGAGWGLFRVDGDNLLEVASSEVIGDVNLIADTRLA